MLLNLLSLHRIWGRPPASSQACPQSRGYVPSESHRTQCLHHRLGNWGTTLYSLTPTRGACRVQGDRGGCTLTPARFWAPPTPARPHLASASLWPVAPAARLGPLQHTHGSRAGPPGPMSHGPHLGSHVPHLPGKHVYSSSATSSRPLPAWPPIWAPQARADLSPPGRGCRPHVQGTALSLRDRTCLGGAFTSAEHTANEHQPVHTRG